MILRPKYKIVRAVFLIFFTFLYTGWQLNAQHSTSNDTEMDQTEEHVQENGQSEHNDAHNEAIEHGEDQHLADHDTGEKELNASEVIMEHVADSHEWHLITTKEGQHVSIPLPVIIYSKNSGLNIFMSNKIAHGHNHKGFEMGHGVMMVEKKDGEIVEKSLKGKVVEMDAHGELVEAGLPLDFSITKNVFMMLLATIILLLVFLGLAKSYKKGVVEAPKGLQGFLEPLVVFVKDDIAIPNIGEHQYKKFMPYLLTVFFFILIHNLMGLIPFFPFGANVTGNIAVTMVLALSTLLITNFSGNKTYWRHIFSPPGVPIWLYPIMIPVELLGIFTKPFALMIRLFANITAGHVIVLSLVSMIFIFNSVWMSIPSALMVLFMDMIELLVAFLQAYIFTLLSALFIGLAMPEHQHE